MTPATAAEACAGTLPAGAPSILLVDPQSGESGPQQGGLALVPAGLELAGGVTEALRIAAETHPDCILLPPGASAIGLAETLRRSFPGTPVFEMLPLAAGDGGDAAAAAVAAERAACRRELEEFIQIAVHDLRAPLRACLTIPSWIRDDLEAANQDFAPIADDVEMLLTQATRMSALLEALSTYARVGHGERPDDTVDLATLAAALARQPGAPADLHLDIAPGLPALALRRQDMEILLRQLLLNAERHSGRPAPRVELAARALPGGGLELSVTDNGQGVAEQYRERVFRPGTTLRPRDEVEGSGMGLAIVRRIARYWGGEAVMDAAPDGQGARVTVTLPRGSPVFAGGVAGVVR
ncbi:hybrid sensor histidine kinase/response regulator [Oceanicella sp. SM1341]|uniref:hybrid sensor histidine kinase/response regulator n=1 Tax=Oceanicella sp. SM1341 TaxID=1548889 RepID=UPI000E4E7927|nr:hybrid sensor histidine kinase/response regulator [Oceanicella sp. SM1341]